MIYSGKKAVVLGLGHSGEAAAILLREEGAEVTICESCDNCRAARKASKLNDQGIRSCSAPGRTQTPLFTTSVSSALASIQPFRSSKTSSARKFP